MISFFGGGTDYADWYSVHGGAFLSMAINYYTYITLRVKPKFQEKEFRVLWRLAEEVKSIDDIKHPIVRETLKEFNYDRGLDISYIGDLPGGSGMGSSSAFTAALVKAIYEDMQKEINPYELAKISYDIEKKKLNETVGVQDQIATSFGGFYLLSIPNEFELSLLYGYWGITTILFFWAALIKATKIWGGNFSQGKAFGILEGGRGFAAAIFSSMALFIFSFQLETSYFSSQSDNKTVALQLVIFFYSFLFFFTFIMPVSSYGSSCFSCFSYR